MVARLWERTEQRGNCLVWTGATTKAGYGLIQARAISPAPLLVHRIAWAVYTGEDPGEMDVLHTCDNPPCIRREHLFLGTQQDNNRDRQQKGRTASGDRNGARTRRDRNSFVANGGSGLRGEHHPQAKVSDSQVEEAKMRRASGEKLASIASDLGISETQVSRIVRSKTRVA